MTGPSPTRARLAALLAWLALLAPAWLYLVNAPRFGFLPENDYYGIALPVLAPEADANLAQRLIRARSNEHRVALPAAVFALNYHLFHGHDLPLSLLALALLAGVFTLLYRALPTAVRRSPRRFAYAAVLAFFAFTPAAADNVAMGFSGILFGSANLLAVLAIFVLARRGRSGGIAGLWPIPVLGLLGIFTFSTSIALWPAVVAAGIHLRLRRRQWLVLALAAAAALSFYASGYGMPRSHPSLDVDPVDAVRFALVFLGAPAGPRTDVALAAGALGLAAALLLAGLILRRAAADRFALWTGLQAYAAANAAAAALARGGFGEEMAVASRYATLPALFWAALLIAAGLYLEQQRPRRHRLAAAGLGLVALLLAAPSLARGRSLIDAFAARGSVHPVAARALVRGYRDADVLRAVSLKPEAIWQARDALRRLHHVPFDRRHPPPVARRLAPAELAPEPHPQLVGLVGGLYPLPGAVYRLGGWVFGRGIEVEEVLIVGRDGWTHGEVVRGIYDPALVRLHGRAARGASWAAYADAGRLLGSTICARPAGDPRCYPLPVSELVRPRLELPGP
ncbi:MAG: hypothetical protein D6696_11810 [Acidobacteria bacterium]|nr:MAG: hypothetical protein D6696_11810 [Acidobacteriota bacterium]